jgi:uncharacterized protein YggE
MLNHLIASRLSGIAFLAAAILAPAIEAQAQAQSPRDGRLIVIGEGSVNVTPDYAQIESGVITTAKTVKEAVDANSKVMAAITSALRESGIADKDVQTSRFSVQQVYATQEPRAEPKVVGFRVSNRVRVNMRQIDKVGEILDRLVAAGTTDVGNIAFLVSDPSKALDRAREAAIADARHKAEVYAQAAGLRLMGVNWITEDDGSAPPIPMRAQRETAAAGVPIATGEDILRVRVTVSFDVAR